MLEKKICIPILIAVLAVCGCGRQKEVSTQVPVKISEPVTVKTEVSDPHSIEDAAVGAGPELRSNATKPASIVPEREPPIETRTPPDFVNPTSTSSNPLFADGVPEHLQCPPEWIGVHVEDESLREEFVSIVETMWEEIKEKWNPHRPLIEIWDSAIERQKPFRKKIEEVSVDVLIQLMLDFPEMAALVEEDWPRAKYMVDVESGEKDPDWNVAVLHDGRVFRMKENHTYQFRFTEVMDVENGQKEMKSYDLDPLIEPSEIWETVIIHLDHVTDEAFERLSGWNYNINPYTTGAYKLGDNKALAKNKQKPDAEARVSPFGLGRYPEVPDDFPRTPSWLNPNSLKSRDLELGHRVWIKLWNQGDKKITGFFIDNNGRYFPLYPNTVYVEYKEIDGADSSIERRLSVVTHGGDISDEARALLREGIIPPDVCVGFVSENNLAIDPYAYLQVK